MHDSLIRIFISQRRKGAELLFDNALLCSKSSAEYNIFYINFLILSAFSAPLPSVLRRLCVMYFRERILGDLCIKS